MHQTLNQHFKLCHVLYSLNRKYSIITYVILDINPKL